MAESLPSTFESSLAAAGHDVGLDHHRALLHAERAVAAAEEVGDLEVARALATRAAIHRHLGHHALLLDDIERGLRSAGGDPGLRSRLLVERAVDQVRRGNHRQGFDDLQEALLCARATADGVMEARVERHLLSMLRSEDREASIGQFRALALRIERLVGDDLHLGDDSATNLRTLALTNLAAVQISTGRTGDAEATLRDATDGSHGRFRAKIGGARMRLLGRVGNPAEVESMLPGLLDEAEREGGHFDRLVLQLIRARCLLYHGAAEEAVAQVEAIEGEALTYSHLRRSVLRLLADAHRAVGDPANAVAAMKRLREEYADAHSAQAAGVRAFQSLQELDRVRTDLLRTRSEADAMAALAGELEHRVEERTAELSQTFQELGRLAEEYRLLAENTADVVARHELDGRIAFISPSARRLLGIAPAALLGRTLRDLAVAEDRRRIEDAFDRVRRSGRPAVEDIRFPREGGSVWLEVTVRPLLTADGTFGAIHSVVRDVSRRRAAEEQLLARSLSDHLTGLANRSRLIGYLHGLVADRAREPGRSFGILLMDVDRFTLVNDSRGHSFGDELLREVAGRVVEASAPGEFVARVGGDEFAVVIPLVEGVDDTALRGALLCEAVEQPWEHDGLVMVPSVSVGLVVGDGASDPEELLRDAGIALHRAKGQGPARVEVFGRGLRAEADRRLETEQLIRRALERDWVRVHLQPIVWAADGTPASAEALVRIDHPEEGLLLPGRFLEVAEETGLIEPIGEAVLAEVGRLLGEWEAAGPVVPVAVNLGLRELTAPGMVQRILEGTPARRGLVNVELTERMLLEGQDAVLRVLDELRDAGVRLVLDDFGTAYSSMAYLRELPVQEVKIDRSFIANLAENPEDRAIVGAIIDLARAFDCVTVAEGVETDAQLRIARDLGCDLIQGFLVARPLPPERFRAEWLTRVERKTAPDPASFPQSVRRA